MEGGQGQRILCAVCPTLILKWMFLVVESGRSLTLPHRDRAAGQHSVFSPNMPLSTPDYGRKINHMKKAGLPKEGPCSSKCWLCSQKLEVHPITGTE